MSTMNSVHSKSIFATVWIHDATASRLEVIFNHDLFPNKMAKPGDIVEMVPIVEKLKGRSNEQLLALKTNLKAGVSTASGDGESPNRTTSRESEESVVHQHQNFLFVIREWAPDERFKQSGLQFSVTQAVAHKFKLQPRSKVRLTLVDKSLVEASHVEIAFRDQYLARSDMWRLAANELSDHCIYSSRRINFVGSVKAQIQGIWIRGQKVQAAYFSSKTRPIFRSSSARFVLFVQMSREMWHFETEGNSEILFNNMINGFLPELFKRWKTLNAHHLVSIVLFTRIVYDGDVKIGNMDLAEESTAVSPSGKKLRYRDFFRVVVNNRESEDWTVILHQLKKEFTVFLKEILVQPTESSILSPIEQPGNEDDATQNGSAQSFVIAGSPSSAIQGNILEAINLACNQFSRDHVDRDLVRTGISIIVITPGTGQFEVSYDMLQMTTENLVANGIGIDLVCLSRPPLHSVPLFRYKNPNLTKSPETKLGNTRSRANTLYESNTRERRNTVTSIDKSRRLSNATIAGKLADAVSTGLTEEKMNTDGGNDGWLFAIPHWVDVSFWSASSEKKSRHHRLKGTLRGQASNVTGYSSTGRYRHGNTFAPRCKMYELQMMGVMENEVANISIPYLHENPLYIPLTTSSDNLTGAKEAQTNPVESKSKTGSNLEISETKRLERVSRDENAMRDYMERYDDFAFKPLAELTKAQEDARIRRQTEDQQRIDEIVQDDSKILSTSFRSSVSPRKGYGLGTEPAYFDRKWKEHQASLESPDEVPKRGIPSNVQDKFTSSSSTRTPSTRNVEESKGNPVRHLSAGFKGGFGLSKAVLSASTSSTTHFPILTRGFTPAAVTAKTSLTASSTGLFSDSLFQPDSRLRDTTVSSTVTPVSVNISGADTKSLSESILTPPIQASRPIAIRSTTSESKDEARPPSILASSPTERKQNIALREGRVSKSDRSQIDSLKAASQARLAAPRLDLTQSSGQSNNAAITGSMSIVLPWLTILNPSNPKSAPSNPKSQFRRWQHVFPRPLRVSSMKWKSLCSPAALPLTTEYFPTFEQLANEYSESPYVIAQNDDDDVEEISRNRKELVREMVSQRLARGFQIVVGTAVQEATANRIGEPDIFAMNYMAKAGSSVYMSMGPHIHQLICDEEYNVEVKRYLRKPTAQKTGGIGTQMITYNASIRSVLSETYQPVSVTLKPPSLDYNWNYVDRYIGGYEEDFVEPMKFWRARFVLIPVEPPSGTVRRGQVSSNIAEGLDDEELRLEGIQKLTQHFQRWRYLPPEERRYQRAKTGKDDNPLEIIFKTANPSVIVAKEVESLPLISESDTNARRQHLITGSEMFERSTMKLHVLAQELQGPRGIRLQDRRWHLRLHYSCFIGSEFVTWMLSNFKDLDTREEAVEYGNDLMKDGLFQHVEKRHLFRDGNFFYQLMSEYVQDRPMSRSGWFGQRKQHGPLSDALEAVMPGTLNRARSNSVLGDNIHYNAEASNNIRKHTYEPPKQRTRVALSKVMKYNIDPGKKSYRPEIVKLHYDRVHNPENCYHIRIEWLNVTAKLIEDSLSTWAKTVQRYGLKLVEAPIDEICTITSIDPFRSPLIVRLCTPPPMHFPSVDVSLSLNPSVHAETFPYHEAILKKFNFVLDIEAAKNFPQDVEVTYSWGAPSYRYTQYIHRSGVVFAQITDLGDFLFLANRLFSQRGVAGDGSKYDLNAQERGVIMGKGSAGANGSTGGAYMAMTFPHAPALNFGNATSDTALLSVVSQQPYVTAEMIKSEVSAFCKDAEKLQALYHEVESKLPTTVPSTPHVGPSSVPASAPLVPTGILGMTLLREPISPAMLALGVSINGSIASGSSASTLTANRSSGSAFSGTKDGDRLSQYSS